MVTQEDDAQGRVRYHVDEFREVKVGGRRLPYLVTAKFVGDGDEIGHDLVYHLGGFPLPAEHDTAVFTVGDLEKVRALAPVGLEGHDATRHRPGAGAKSFGGEELAALG